MYPVLVEWNRNFHFSLPGRPAGRSQQPLLLLSSHIYQSSPLSRRSLFFGLRCLWVSWHRPRRPLVRISQFPSDQQPRVNKTTFRSCRNKNARADGQATEIPNRAKQCVFGALSPNPRPYVALCCPRETLVRYLSVSPLLFDPTQLLRSETTFQLRPMDDG